MGRIKSLMVKRAAKQLLSLKNSSFSSSFEDNKRILGNKMPSKSIRNKIAGYISRLTIMKQNQLKNQSASAAQEVSESQKLQAQ